MRGIPSSFLFIFFITIFLVELISYFGFRILISHIAQKARAYFSIFYGLISLSVIAVVFYAFSNPEALRHSRDYTFFFVVISLGFLNLIPKTIFALMTLLSFILRGVGSKRWQLIALSGSLLISTGIFGTIAYGIWFGRQTIRTEHQNLYFPDLPQELDGLKIVQLSDIHLGSYGNNHRTIEKTVKAIEQVQPDIILFTGDIVNNFAEEIIGFEPYLKQLQARYGKFGIVGNHDYGDYSAWPDSISKQQNLIGIHKGLTEAGFRLLLNQWEKVEIKDTSVCIIGVENWGHAPFPQYARLDLAMNNIPENSFKILMTHDPAHWEAKVVPETNIPLTLSGHTHGAQFGIKIAGIEFSPIRFIQKNWGGLYQSENQFLYVNRGLGTIGFPGRIEMRPEITVLTLYRSRNH